jgi:hypothetical protein
VVQIRIEPSSLLSILSGYGLDDRENEVRFPADAKDFSSNLCVQTGSGVHRMGTESPFPGTKARSGRDADRSPHLVPKSKMSRSYTLSRHAPPWRVVGQILLSLRFHCRVYYNLTLDHVATQMNPLHKLTLSSL